MEEEEEMENNRSLKYPPNAKKMPTDSENPHTSKLQAFLTFVLRSFRSIYSQTEIASKNRYLQILSVTSSYEWALKLGAMNKLLEEEKKLILVTIY